MSFNGEGSANGQDVTRDFLTSDIFSRLRIDSLIGAVTESKISAIDRLIYRLGLS
jgi:hypothetical protein